MAAPLTARDYFMEAFEPAGGWADQAQLDRAFRALSVTQQGVIAKLGETRSFLHRLPGGFWTYDGCGVNAAGAPAWWVTWATVRAMERRGLLVRSWFYTDDWKDHRHIPTQAEHAARTRPGVR